MFYDIDNNPQASTQLSVGSDAQVILYHKVDAIADKTLKAVILDGQTDLAIEIQVQGSDWVDAINTGIDLTPYDGTVISFGIRITAPESGSLSIEQLVWRLV